MNRLSEGQYNPNSAEEGVRVIGSKQRCGVVRGILNNVSTILIVDTEEILRDLVQSVIASDGYSVLTARDGREAIRVFSRFHAQIALVLSDVRLAKIAGEDLLRGLRRIDPKVRVLFASVFMSPELELKLLHAGATGFIPKFQTSAELLDRIGNILNG